MDIIALVFALDALGLAEALSSIGTNLSGWNCATGLPTTTPPGGVPYTYTNGCYYLVSAIAESGGTNYKPTGTTYTGAASTVAETGTVHLFDMYRYNSEGIWELLSIGGLLSALVHDVKLNGTSVVDEDNIAQINNVLLCVAQTLTDAQKLQARTNIGAITYTKVSAKPSSLDEGVIAFKLSEDNE